MEACKRGPQWRDAISESLERLSALNMNAVCPVAIRDIHSSSRAILVLIGHRLKLQQSRVNTRQFLWCTHCTREAFRQL